ncbi:hypothetical protein VTO73DRAFT_15433 [Trametes versicolor]
MLSESHRLEAFVLQSQRGDVQFCHQRSREEQARVRLEDFPWSRQHSENDALLITVASARHVFNIEPALGTQKPTHVIEPNDNLDTFLSQSWEFHAAIAQKYWPVIKLHWLFGTSALYVFDPLTLTHIIKNQEKFDQPAWYVETHNMMLGPGLLSVTGDTHRKQRKMLTPVFSAKHLRTVVPIFYQVTDKLIQAISARVLRHSESTDIDVLGWMSRAALELIGQGGIGYSFDPLVEDVSDAYADAAKYFVVTATSPEMIPLRQMAPFLKHLGPSRLLRWVMENSPVRLVRRIVQITDVLHQRSLEIFRAKRAAIEAGDDSDSKDILSIMLRANMAASGEDQLPEDQLLGQMSTIIFAAMDTTSNAMARTLQLLAEHPQMQTKLRREIADAKVGGNQLDYDQLHALP